MRLSLKDEVRADTPIQHLDIPVSLLKALSHVLRTEGLPLTYGNALTIPDRKLLSAVNIGPASVARWNRFKEHPFHHLTAPIPVQPWPDENEQHQRRLDLNSLLLAFESATIRLYDLQRADASPDDFLDIDIEGTIAKTKARIESIREKILAYAEKG